MNTYDKVKHIFENTNAPLTLEELRNHHFLKGSNKAAINTARNRLFQTGKIFTIYEKTKSGHPRKRGNKYINAHYRDKFETLDNEQYYKMWNNETFETNPSVGMIQQSYNEINASRKNKRSLQFKLELTEVKGEPDKESRVKGSWYKLLAGATNDSKCDRGYAIEVMEDDKGFHYRLNIKEFHDKPVKENILGL